MRAPAPLLTWLRNTIGVLPIRSVTLAAILDPGAAVDLAGGASVAAAFTCASALHIEAVRLLRAAACLRCLRGVATSEFRNVLPCTQLIYINHFLAHKGLHLLVGFRSVRSTYTECMRTCLCVTWTAQTKGCRHDRSCRHAWVCLLPQASAQPARLDVCGSADKQCKILPTLTEPRMTTPFLRRTLKLRTFLYVVVITQTWDC